MPPAASRHRGRIEDIDGAFVVKDGSGQKLAYVVFFGSSGIKQAIRPF